MKHFQLLIDAEVASGKVNLIYQLLGKFGDKLPKDIQDELYKLAEEEESKANSKKKKVIMNLK